MGTGPGWLVGTLAAAAVAGAARWAGALSRGGALAAAVVGGIIFGWGGAGGALPLLFFFLTGTALSRWHKARKAQRLEHSDAQGRRAGQVLANGGVAALAVAGAALWPAPIWWAAFGGAIAAATADTWATELGVLARRAVLITTLAPAPIGRSGAVSASGTAGGVAGAVLAAGVAAWAAAWDAPGRLLRPGGAARDPGPALGQALAGTWAGTDPFLALAVPAAVGGIAGMLLDSLLGATVQERFRCPVCQRETEAPVHRCGTPTQRVGGWRGVNNDVVNFCATLAGALVAAGMHRVLGGL